jgi:homoserine O-succinyltransferase
MPIRLPSGFPANNILQGEGISVIAHKRAVDQEIRPLRVIIFNLMPTKIDTEVQILRLLSRSSIQIESFFLKVSSHEFKHDVEHLKRFYYSFDELKGQKFDAIIITGAPVEQMPFKDVDYWDEFCEIVHWASHNVFAKLFICWGAQAGMYIDFDIDKHNLESKLFGIYPHTIIKDHEFTRGFDDIVMIPQSRHTDINHNELGEIIRQGKLVPLVSSTALGSNILTTPKGHKTYVLGHLEYDRETLENEYKRDISEGKVIDVPKNYYAKDDPSQSPEMSWKSHANLFFINWINYVYQETPFDLDTLKPCVF